MTRTWIVLLGLLLAACNTGAPAGPPKINAFTATPASLPSGGGSVRLEWDVNGASSLDISGVGSVTPADRGSKTVNLTTSRTFTLTATNSAGSVSKDASVTVAPAPSISVTPTSSAFVAGDPGGSFDAVVIPNLPRGDTYSRIGEWVVGLPQSIGLKAQRSWRHSIDGRSTW
ncbi:hypothetical protein, partial [Meiothermus taiwanensis]